MQLSVVLLLWYIVVFTLWTAGYIQVLGHTAASVEILPVQDLQPLAAASRVSG